MTDVGALIGERLRSARRERGLSVGRLSSAAGVGKGSLSEIENGARNPTLGTLYALADALGVPLATLLDERVGTAVAAPGFTATLLDVAHHDATTSEVYRLRFDAGSRRDSGPHGPGVVEHLLVTAGHLLAGPVGEERPLGPGESASWRSDVTHTYRASPDGPAEAVVVIRSPATSPDPA